MTTEKEKVPSAADVEVEIVDTTPPEVDAAVDAAAAQAKGQPAPSAQVEPPPQTEAPTPEPVKEPEPQKAPEPPKQRTYSEDEWSKMRRAEAERQNALSKRLAALEEQQTRSDMEAQVEGYRRAVEADLVAKNYDPAQAAAYAQTAATERRTALQYQRQLQRTEQDRQRAVYESEAAAKTALARDIGREHGLDTEDVDSLMAVETPEAMVKLGARLGKAKSAITSAEKAKRDSVPPVKTESGNSANAPANALEESFRRIEAGEATEADWAKYRQWRNT